jgi:flagellin-like protein
MKSSSKGITPVIAVILLLLITISMVGFAFVWFQRVAITTTSAVENQTRNILEKQQQVIKIDNIDSSSGTDTKVYIRATGTQSIPNSGLQVYVNGARQTCAWDLPTLNPGSIIKCTFAPVCTSGATLRVTAPGNLDETRCP